MSGSTGADRIKSREDFKQFLTSYTSVIKKFPGFVSIEPSGSYNSNPNKKDFGDIDLITHIKSNKDKKEVKKDLVAFFSKMSDTVIVPFGSDRYKGKKSLNTGEIVTIRYHDKKLGYSVQVDNIIALSQTEADFKKKFLDFPAEKQGLILGLVKVATLENPLKPLFTKLGIKVDTNLPKDQEYEFNLSSIELQLRHVFYEEDSFKQTSREVVWKTRNFEQLKKLLPKFDLDKDFDALLQDAKKKLKNPRSKRRIVGVFTSMVSVKSGEINTPKGDEKNRTIKKIQSVLGESVMRFGEYLCEVNKDTVVFTFGRFQPPTTGHKLVVDKVKSVAKEKGADYVIYTSKTQDKKKNPLDVATKIEYLKKMFPGTKFKAANDKERTPIEVVISLNKKYKHLIMVAGSDRVETFKELLNKYNGKEYNYSSIEVVSSGERDPDSDSVSGISGTKLRDLAVSGDFASFKKGVSGSLSDADIKTLMHSIKQGLGK